MPESPNQGSSNQRRANWVGLRTLRQLPKPVGETAGGEPVYDVRSVRLLLDGTAANFVRLAECSRCGRDLAGAPVMTIADLDLPLRPVTCTDCSRGSGVSTVSESEGGEPAGERPAPATMAAPDPVRLHVMEGHLRAVTERVNELGRVARAHQADVKDRSQREEATGAAVRDELAALRTATEDTRAELQRQAVAKAEMERRLAEIPPAGDSGAAPGLLHEEVAQLAHLVEAQRGEVVGFVLALGETQVMTRKLGAAQEALAEIVGHFDPSKVEDLIASRLVEVEARLAHQIAGQGGDLETAIESSVQAHLAGVRRAYEELAGGQAVLEERIHALAGQMAEVSSRIEMVLGRLDALEALPRAPAPPADITADLPVHDAPPRTVLGSLDRQLEAAARRLAARSDGATWADQ